MKTYYIRVTPQNAAGLGSPTSSLPATMIPRSPPLAPLAVEVNAVRDSTTCMRVKWDKPSSNNGDAISTYKIEWAAAGTNFAVLESKSVTGAELVSADTAHPAAGSFY